MSDLGDGLEALDIRTWPSGRSSRVWRAPAFPRDRVALFICGMPSVFARCQARRTDRLAISAADSNVQASLKLSAGR